MDLMDYRRKMIANSPHPASASGAIATFPDGADLPLKSITVDITPIQSGSGDPSPSNIRLMSGRTSVTIERSGKNLIYPKYSGRMHNGITYTVNDDGTISARGTATAISYAAASLTSQPAKMTCLPAGTYYLTGGISSSEFVYLGGKYVDGTNFSVMYDRGSGAQYIFTKPVYVYPQIYIAKNTTTDRVFNIQLEQGSTATPFEACRGKTVTIQLEQTLYGGTLDPLTGILTIDSRLITLSSTGVGNYAYNSSQKQLRITSLKPMANVIDNICSHYKSFSGSFSNLPDKSLMASSSTLAIKDTDYASLSAWLTYLDAQAEADTPVQARVKLAEVTTVQLTPQQIRSIYGSNAIFADAGDVTLEYWAHA